VLYEEAIAVERVAEESIFQAENDLARIKKGIDTSNEEINRLRETIDELTSQREQKQLERESLLVGLENANKNLNIASQKIQKENANLVNAIADSEDK
jgi:chromosome segregation ATPase